MKTRWMVLASLVASSSAAYADRDRADLLNEAQERSVAGDHEGAIDIYEHVYANESDLDLLVRIGSEYRAIGRPLEAVRYHCTYLTLAPVGTNAKFASDEVVAGLEVGRGAGGGRGVHARFLPADPRRRPPRRGCSLAPSRR